MSTLITIRTVTTCTYEVPDDTIVKRFGLASDAAHIVESLNEMTDDPEAIYDIDRMLNRPGSMRNGVSLVSEQITYLPGNIACNNN